MKKCTLASVITLQLITASFAQAPAYVPQYMTTPNAGVPQISGSSGAFVDQLPPGSRPRQIQAAPTPTLVQQQYILPATKNDSEDRALVIASDTGISPFLESRPALPRLETGVSVSLNPGNESLPSVGAGTVGL